MTVEKIERGSFGGEAETDEKDAFDRSVCFNFADSRSKQVVMEPKEVGEVVNRVGRPGGWLG